MIRTYNEAFLKDSKEANLGRAYQQCRISVMDTIADPNISFDENGICNYYYAYKESEKASVMLGQEGETALNEILIKIKDAAKGYKYDCITGISGGVDSTYLSLLAKKLGLNPLIVHFDNGWNSELAVKNIENIINKLGFDLYTLVVDWNEFKDMQLSYLKASVVDIEAITDHAIMGTLYRLAAENNIKYILSGGNTVTEFVLPSYWVFNKSDHANIVDIHSKFGRLTMKTYPLFNTRLKQHYIKAKGIKTVYPLNYIEYNKDRIKEIISAELDWKDYGGKHYESIWTRFYQGYILPIKFNIDKRKAHLSNLIFSGQITKEDALAELKKPIYELNQLQIDYEFVMKKLNLNDKEFDDLMSMPRREHSEYDFEKSVWERHPNIGFLRPLWQLILR